MRGPTALAHRLDRVHDSATLRLAARARAMQSEGRDVISLTAGEPDFPTAPHVLAAVERCLARGLYRYTAAAGLPELRQAIARRVELQDGLRFSPAEIVVSTGAKQALMSALQALLDPGDEVLIVAPFWLSYADMTELAGGTPRLLPTTDEAGFRVSPAQLADAIGPRTRILILNSPSNPAGATYDEAALVALAEVVRAHPQVVVVLDEIYRRIHFTGRPAPSLLAVAPDLRPRTLIIDGASKTYAMTGFRLGWALGPEPLIEGMTRVQAQTTSSPVSPSQYGAIAALEGDQGWVDEMVRAYASRSRTVVAALRAIPGVELVAPEGAFYAFPRISAFLGLRSPTTGAVVADGTALVEYLLAEHGVVTVPGGPFGSEAHLRLSFATSPQLLEDGLGRLRRGLLALVS